ncbi:MAG: hypothetical protein IPL90_16905 [Holophagales bacterium]|nr:hypothetical protein [Holophagales bacterium]
MSGANSTARIECDPPSLRFRDRSFVLAGDLSREDRWALEREIEARGGSIHPFLTAVTDVLVVGRAEGNEAEASWAREQIRRGTVYQERWGHLELISQEELRAAIRGSRGEPV